MKYFNNLNELNNFIDLIPEITFFKNTHGQYTHFNQLFLDSLECTKENIYLKNDFEIFSKQNAQEYIKTDHIAREQTNYIEVDEVFFHHDGRVDYFRSRKIPIYNYENEQMGILTIAKNITHRKYYEMIHEDSTKLLRFISIENNFDLTLDKILKSLEKRLFFSQCSIIFDKENPVKNDNNNWLYTIYSSHNKKLAYLNIKHDKNRTPMKLEKNLITTYTQLISLSIEKNNKSIKQKKTLKDINQKTKTLTNYQKNLLALFEKSNAVLFKWRNDPKWTVEDVSSSIQQLTGFSVDDFCLKGINYSSRIHPDDYLSVRSEVEYLIENNLDYFKHKPYRIVTKDNEEKWVLDHTVTQKDQNNNITHFVGYITDITEQKKQQDIIFQQSKMASLGEMIGNISHQWRQPLSAITSCATGLKIQKEYDVLSDEIFYKACDSINENTQFLSKTIDDFRNFILSNQEKIKFNLSDVLKSFLNLITPSLKNHEIKVITEFDNEIVLMGSPNELKQSLMNLFSNAKDAFKDEKTKVIFIKTYTKNKYAYLEFKDNGGGVEPSIKEKIFEPYYTTKHQSQGTGIGLSMTYNLITQSLEGKIDVENEEFEYDNKLYKGAVFTITLPLIEVD